MAHNHQVIDAKDMSGRKQAAVISFVVSLILMLLKFYAYRLTGSEAILSDALESIVNVSMAVVLFFVLWYSTKPKDLDHPYGHGKVECLSSAFEGGLIGFAGFFIIISALEALSKGVVLQQLREGLVIVAIAGVVNLFLGLYLQKMGKRKKSISLQASGAHILSDFYTSVGILLGVFLVYLTDWKWLDPLLAIFVALFLLKTSWGLLRDSVREIMDEENLEVLETLKDTFNKVLVSGVIQIHNVRVIRSGSFHHIDAHVVVPEFWDVKKAHEQLEIFEEAVLKEYPYQGELHLHLDPCLKNYCESCDLKDCHIRKAPFKKRRDTSLEELRAFDEPNKN